MQLKKDYEQLGEGSLFKERHLNSAAFRNSAFQVKVDAVKLLLMGNFKNLGEPKHSIEHYCQNYELASTILADAVAALKPSNEEQAMMESSLQVAQASLAPNNFEGVAESIKSKDEGHVESVSAFIKAMQVEQGIPKKKGRPQKKSAVCEPQDISSIPLSDVLRSIYYNKSPSKFLYSPDLVIALDTDINDLPLTDITSNGNYIYN